jgi:RNA polymerase sigma factor (sigma-70 family)
MISKSKLVEREMLRELAEKMIGRYARGLLNVDELMKHLEQFHESGCAPGEVTLESLVRGLCSQAICEACRLGEGDRRDLAFERLSEYLERVLRDTGGTIRRAAREVREEVLQGTLVEILVSLQRDPGKPEQPMAFLGWARVILLRQLTRYWRQQFQEHTEHSLEQEDAPERLVVEPSHEQALDPLHLLLRQEARRELQAAVARLRNPRYRVVLSRLYFGEQEAREVADFLHVPVSKVHLWHFRALHALRKQGMEGALELARRGDR